MDQLVQHSGRTSINLHSSPVDQLAENSWSHFCYSPLITRRSAGRVLMVTLRLLSTHHSWITWQSTAGHTSVTLHSSPVDRLAGYSWSHFCYSPLITCGSAGRVQQVKLRLLSTHHPWISWQCTAGHTSITLHSSSMDQLVQHSGRTSITLHSSPVDQLAKHNLSHFCYSPVITSGSVTDHSWSHFCYSLLITHGSAGRVQLVTLLLLSTHYPWISWQSTAGHTYVNLHSSPVDQLAKYSWSHFCYSSLITRGSAGREILISFKQKLLIVIN